MDTDFDEPAAVDIDDADAQIDDRDDGTSSPQRRWPWLAVLFLIVTVIGSVLSVGFGRDPTVVQSVFLDRASPPLTGPTLDGPPFELADHRGNVAVVNVWASWCTACKEEHPELEAAAQRLSPHGVQFVGINTQDTVDAAREFLDEMGGSSYPSVLDPDGRKSVDWGVFGVPETFIVDADGNVRAKAVGAVNQEWIVRTVELFLPDATTP